MAQPRDINDDSIGTLEIEFIGGPYDGYKKAGFISLAHLPDNVVWMVSEYAIRQMDGLDESAKRSITSVALYELSPANGVFQYRFAGAVSGRDFLAMLRDP